MSGRDDKRPTVPKFSSFKPKPAEPTPAPASSKTKEDDVKRPSHRPSKHHRHRHRSHRHGDKRSRTTSRSPSPKRARTRERSEGPTTREPEVRLRDDLDGGRSHAAQQQPTKDLGSDFFIIDKRGDPMVRKFGVDRYKLLQFRRPNREAVLGSDGYLYIHRDGPLEQFSIRRPGEFYGVSLRDKNAFRNRLRQVQPRMLRASKRAAAEADGPSEDFISLRPPKRKKRGGRESEEDECEHGPDYRSIEGKAKAAGASGGDTELESSAEEEEEEEDTVVELDPLKERSIELTRRVKDKPDDIPAWIELINHQDLLMKAGGSGQDIPIDEVKSFAEIKLSMYEKALAQVKNPFQKEQLLVGQVREGAKVWDVPVQDAHWKKIQKEVDGSFLLWRLYLDYKLSNIASFQYGTVKKIFLDRLALLSGKVAEEVIRVKQKALYSELIYVFLRATRFFYDCGYRELSVAAWQALLELNLRGPEFPNPSGPVPESFHTFWESEVPRLGEPDARGWNYFIASNGDDSNVPEPAAPDPGPQRTPSRDAYKAWAVEELYRSRRSRMPARTLDEDNLEDPFRLIMYSDLEGLPFIIPGNLLDELKGELLDAYLTFCEFPPLSSKRAWKTDAHLSQRDFAFEHLVSHAEPRKSPEGDDSTTRSPPEFVKKAITAAVAPKHICSLLHLFKGVNKDELPVEFSWVLLTLKTLVVAGYEELAGYCLALEWIADAGSVRKAARTLIKQYSQNIGLYNLYGLFEWANGNFDLAKKVLSSATQLSQPTGLESTRQLWFTWAWIEFMNEAETSTVLSRLCLIPDEGDSNLPLTFVLKKKQELRMESENAFVRDDIYGFVVNAKLLALAEYLSSDASSEPKSEKQGSISAAMDIIWKHSERLLIHGHGECSQHEELLEFASMLLYRHTTMG